MLDKIKQEILDLYKEHPKASIGVGIAMMVTLGVMLVFGTNSTLFQGTLKLNLNDQVQQLDGNKIDLNLDKITNVSEIGNNLDIKPTPEIDLNGTRTTDINSRSDINGTITNPTKTTTTTNTTTTTGTNKPVSPTGTVSVSPSFSFAPPDNLADENFGRSTSTTFDVSSEVNSGFRDLLGFNDEEEPEEDATPPAAGNQVATNNSVTPPVVDNVEISGAESGAIVGTLLTAEYLYIDDEPETNTRFRWLKSNSANDFTNATVVGTEETYTLTTQDVGKFLIVEVTPVNAKAEGDPTESVEPVGPVTAAVTTTNTPAPSQNDENIVNQTATLTSASLEGSAEVGQTIRLVTNFTGNSSDLDITWLAADEDFNITTLATDVLTFQIPASLANNLIAVEVTAPNSQTVTTQPIGPVINIGTPDEELANVNNNDDDILDDVVGTSNNVNNDDEDLVTGNNGIDTEDQLAVNDFNLEDQFINPSSGSTNGIQTINTGVINQNFNQGSSGSTNLSLTSNTNANLLQSAQVQGDTGPEAILIFPLLGFASWRTGRRLARKRV